VPVGPGVNPLWFHQTLKLSIGGVDYGFQTLSIFDVWTIWPHLAPIKEASPSLLAARDAMRAGRLFIGFTQGLGAGIVQLFRAIKLGIEGEYSAAIAAAKGIGPAFDAAMISARLTDEEKAKVLGLSGHIVKILEIIQPALAADEERLKEMTPEHFTALFQFYTQQDWSRILVLVERTNEVGESADETEPTKAHYIFMELCKEAARQCGMPVLDFVRSRFEFCADQIVALHHAAEKALEESEDGRASNWKDATLNLAATFGVKPEAIAEDKKPAWMKVLDRVKVVH
jgi:hypothetical protein